MALDKDMRDRVNQYVFRHVVPKNVSPRPRTAMEWFTGLFLFIDDPSLQKYLAEALYQARYIGRLQEALKLTGAFNRTFVKQQILLYASVYEAVIDFYLDRFATSPEVAPMMEIIEFKQQTGVLGSSSKLTFQDANGDHDIVPCRAVSRQRTLQEIRFDQRVAAAVRLGGIARESEGFRSNVVQDSQQYSYSRSGQQGI